MATRKCFLINTNNEVEEVFIEFQYISGRAFSQQVKCAKSLEDAIKKAFPNSNHLEVSTKSSKELGTKLSAFNLILDNHSVESIYQSSKVFEGGIQYEFLLEKNPFEAKRYIRENGQGRLVKFRYKETDYPLVPETAFYDWLFINALDKSEYAEQVLEYNIFSDIEFNDKKAISCQARSVAMYVAMVKNKEKDKYLVNFESFIKIYEKYGTQQLSLI